MIKKERIMDVRDSKVVDGTTESGIPVRKLGDVKTQEELDDEKDLRIHNKRKNGPFYPMEDLFIKYGLK